MGGIKGREKYITLFLGAGHIIIRTRTFSEEIITEAVIYPRAMLKTALDCNIRQTDSMANHLTVKIYDNNPAGTISTWKPHRLPVSHPALMKCIDWVFDLTLNEGKGCVGRLKQNGGGIKARFVDNVNK